MQHRISGLSMIKKVKFQKKEPISIIIDKNEDNIYEAFYFTDEIEGSEIDETINLCSLRENEKAKEPVIGTIVDLIDCIKKEMKGKNYELSYLLKSTKEIYT